MTNMKSPPNESQCAVEFVTVGKEVQQQPLKIGLMIPSVPEKN